MENKKLTARIEGEFDEHPPKLSEEQLDFLRKKASLELIAEIGEQEHCRHRHLRDVFQVSSSTLSNRLKRGNLHNFFKSILITKEDGGEYKAYELDIVGELIYDKLQSLDLNALYSERRKINTKIDQKEDELVNNLPTEK